MKATPVRLVCVAVSLLLLCSLYGFAAPSDEVAGLVGRLGPILLFLAAISIVVNLSAKAGVFDQIAEMVARSRASRGLGLWFVVVGLSVVSTAFLSLDTTAVLVTPLVFALALRSGTDPGPLVLTVVWISNTGSLFLPVSNLTNLLAVGSNAFAGSTGGYLRLAVLPATISVLVTILFAGLVFRRRLARRDVAGLQSETDEHFRSVKEGRTTHRLMPLCAGVLAVLMPLLTTPIPVWWSASVAAAIVLVAFRQVDRASVRMALVPWSAIAIAVGVVVAVQLALDAGAEQMLRSVLVTEGTGVSELFVLSGAAALASNMLNNLPAYLLFEPAAGSDVEIMAVLIGSNAGPLITPWASLATLLWADQLRRAGIKVSWCRYAALGGVLAVIAVGASTAVLVFTAT